MKIENIGQGDAPYYQATDSGGRETTSHLMAMQMSEKFRDRKDILEIYQKRYTTLKNTIDSTILGLTNTVTIAKGAINYFEDGAYYDGIEDYPNLISEGSNLLSESKSSLEDLSIKLTTMLDEIENDIDYCSKFMKEWQEAANSLVNQ